MKYCPVCKAKYDDGVSFCSTDGEVLEDDATSLVDSVLDGQYHIESMLGKGGMGAVYCARHILLGDKVAIKVLPPQMRNNAEWLRRFRREGQAARRFRHPNAVTVYDLRTTTDGLVYMVMEFVEGYTLDAELKRRGRFSTLEAFTVLEPVMSVLNAAHAMGVVHRDLKPENIMLGKPGEDGLPVTKLLDLGIAKMREVAGADASGTTALTMAGQVLGTPFYMSPEQWGEVPKDGNTEIDGRADIYSLGVVFYEIVAGRRPFTGLTLQELRREHVSVSPRPLNEVAPDVPEAFSRAILRAMSKDRGDRQATAGELAAELRAALDLPAHAISSPSLNLAGGAQSSGQGAQTGVSTSGAGSTGQTSENVDKRGTSADVIAPTIITVDAPPRPRQDNQQPLAATSLAQPASPTSPPHMPSFPSLDQPAPSYAPPMEAPRRSSKTPLIIAIVAVLLIGGGIGIWLLMSNRSGATSTSSTNTGNATANAKEALNYWLEVAEAGPNGESARVAGTVPLASGQSFKFHFKPDRDGYFYIVGPGDENAPSTFLTNKPNGDFAKTNEVKAGTEFVFPAGDDNWIELDKKPGTEIYTIIFSPTRLSEPAFLSEDAADLTATEQKVFDDFKTKYKANAPATNVINGGGTDPLVSVKIPQAAENEPVIFDVRIEHK
ncbi:MAG TPA: protein kinase [Pyrinomonadaceae bacterium]|nr:protein kinase [Pyrinomonadaceae bacterium]